MSWTDIGKGLNVFDTEPVEGRSRWLDSPQDVLAFATSGEDVSDVVVIARGGTTTFVAPALSLGVRGVLTLQGGVESHLGIVSREFGIPCIVGVSFTEGRETERGEKVPEDGTLLRLDTSGVPEGLVQVGGA
jgi:phosphoenolpyruvate-protein kinase (PTS system EI component)